MNTTPVSSPPARSTGFLTDCSPNELSTRFADLRLCLEALREDVRSLVREFVDTANNPAALVLYSKSLEAIMDDLETLRAIEERSMEISEEVVGHGSDKASKSAGTGLRSFKVEMTDGMIKQSLLTLTHAKKRGLIKVGESLAITLPDGRKFETQVVEPGNRLRERGLIRSFYETEKISAGDLVLLTETAAGEWKIQKAPAKDYAKDYEN